MTPMINPYQLRPSHQRLNNLRLPGGKGYLAAFTVRNMTFFSRHVFRTASAASEHAVKVVERWKPLYDAAIMAMMAEPTQ
jgi:hypothetical protein